MSMLILNFWCLLVPNQAWWAMGPTPMNQRQKGLALGSRHQPPSPLLTETYDLQLICSATEIFLPLTQLKCLLSITLGAMVLKLNLGSPALCHLIWATTTIQMRIDLSVGLMGLLWTMDTLWTIWVHRALLCFLWMEFSLNSRYWWTIAWQRWTRCY